MPSLSYRQCTAVSELTASLQPITVQLLQSAQLHSGSTSVTKVITEVSWLQREEDTALPFSSLQLALSQLRAVCSLVEVAGEAFIQPLLPILLAALKFYRTTGLRSQPSCTAPLPQAFSACLYPLYMYVCVDSSSTRCEPHSSHSSHNTVPTVPKQKKDKRCTTITGPKPPHRQPRPAKSPARSLSARSTSDNEVSNSEQPDMASSKALACQLCHQALVCLADLFLVSLFPFLISSLCDPHTLVGHWST